MTADHAHHSDNSESSVLPLKSISTSVLQVGIPHIMSICDSHTVIYGSIIIVIYLYTIIQLQLCVLQTPRNSTEP